MKGYKVFNPDWTCLGFQYEVGKTYEERNKLIICVCGFHFCKKAVDCFNYYNFDPNNKVAEITAHGNIVEKDDKSATNKIEIVREIPWGELLEMVNTGKANTGRSNSGNCNSGDCNSGDYNNGNYNSGDCNSGDYNSGDCNSGNRNSGNYNSGNRNSGNYNSGGYNSGDYNSGDYNSGDWNAASFATGYFNTENSKLKFFDKETDMTFEEWRCSSAYFLLRHINSSPVRWINSSKMTDEEKKEHPEYKTTGGYLKPLDNSNCCIEWWNGLTSFEKEIIREIPNFDAGKFKLITGIEV